MTWTTFVRVDTRQGRSTHNWRVVDRILTSVTRNQDIPTFFFVYHHYVHRYKNKSTKLRACFPHNPTGSVVTVVWVLTWGMPRRRLIFTILRRVHTDLGLYNDSGFMLETRRSRHANDESERRHIARSRYNCIIAYELWISVSIDLFFSSCW